MDIRLLADSIFSTYRLVLSRFRPGGDGLEPLHTPDFDFELLCRVDAELRPWLVGVLQDPQPRTLISQLNCLWVAFPYERELLVVGPVNLAAPDKRQLLRILQKAQVCASLVQPAAETLLNLPVSPLLEMIRLCTHLYHLVSGSAAVSPNFAQHQPTASLAITDDVAYSSETKDFMASRRADLLLKECVKNGDLELLGRLELYSVPNPARVAKDELRRAKNLFIVTLTIVSRAAMSGGLPMEIAYPLSDEYMMRNESLTSEAQVWKLNQTCVLDYTQRVRDMQNTVHYGKVVSKCRSFVLANIGEDLKICRIAAALGVNPEYLSRQFKKETGQTLLEYIHSAKLYEAKNLLLYSDFDVAKISMRLGYASQSQFATQFKKYTGMTPGQFRKTN